MVKYCCCKVLFLVPRSLTCVHFFMYFAFCLLLFLLRVAYENILEVYILIL